MSTIREGYEQVLYCREHRCVPNDFERVRCLGKNCGGLVWMCRLKATVQGSG